MQINSFEALGRIIPLLTAAPFYSTETLEESMPRFLNAIAYDKIRYYMRDDQMIGFVTWCFLTREESQSMEYSWDEAFSRQDGEELWVVDMVALDSVISIGKECRNYIFGVTGHKVAYWRRPNGRMGKATNYG